MKYVVYISETKTSTESVSFPIGRDEIERRKFGLQIVDNRAIGHLTQ